ncbi:MAG: DUF4038 domain-containing protein [Anaerolineae bacterium]|nr:DUF4038 domain-containing protein [Anaerolineae bacterium]
MKKLKVSPNQRFLMTEDGEPFFWMGDTAWELFHRCTREQIEIYLENRRQKGFNVIQAVILAEEDGLGTPNMYGDCPLIDLDPEQPNEAYFEVVDFTIEKANQKGLYVGLLPTWGDKAVPMWGVGPVVFTPENAKVYGNWLAKRYQAFNNIIWILGGDRPIISEQGGDARALWSQMAEGIKEVRDDWLITYHPNGGRVEDSKATVVHAQDWADLVMYQSGHGQADSPTWQDAAVLYDLEPAKPFLDGEINYEDHAILPSWPKWNPLDGYFRDHDVRKQMYRSVFAGACGVTYGHHHVWQMWDYHREVKNNGFELRPWYDAIDRPATFQVKHLVNLMTKYPYFSRIPDQSIILSDAGVAGQHICATRDREGNYVMVYVPDVGQQVQVDLSVVKKPYEISLFDPRTGYTHPIEGQFQADTYTFTSPVIGPDWVLLIEKA